MPEGDSMLFTITDPYHYPVYLKDSVMNSNEEFDYGSFLTLASSMQNKQASGVSSTTYFAFTFEEAGSYVFVDAEDSEQIMIVIVVGAGQ